LLAFLGIEFFGRLSRTFWILLGLWVVCGLLLLAPIRLPVPYILLALIITLADCVRVMWRALSRRRAGRGSSGRASSRSSRAWRSTSAPNGASGKFHRGCST
ncbi:MAG TPA: hypothetical protein VM870_05760, partial [Pyrinomonadaceae bacterium]|nr:hypothetical protein [Pyrinomonadaceae bacterium]